MLIITRILSNEQMEQLRVRQGKNAGKRMRAKYEVLFQSGCDFGIEKRIGKTKTDLIMLVSREQYYVSECGGVKNLTIPLLRKFLAELEGEISLPGVSWLTGLRNDRNMAARILHAVRDPEERELLKKGMFYVYSDNEMMTRSNMKEITQE